ncbi:SCO family protein [Schlesneria sp. DSM 10557]|uniref:SCO family protein n=1 Tax=Schlesneria sp. DSM 10557 TaxID=3044399 RepID=UPI0035A16D26
MKHPQNPVWSKTFGTCAVWVLGIALCDLILCSSALAQRFATGGPYNSPAGRSPSTELLRDVGIEQRLNAQLPLDGIVVDEHGSKVQLDAFFREKPVVLALVQYRCPMLCTQVLNGFFKVSHAIPLKIGVDYDFIAVSFDPREGSELAAEKKRQYVRMTRQSEAEAGIHFLTADQALIDRLTDTVGFHYRYVEETDQFAHASGVIIVTPDGRVSRYFYGIEYSPHDLRLGLVESSNGAIGSPVEQFLLLCYHYDPLTGKYGLAIAGLLRWAGILTALVLGTYLYRMYRRECARSRLVQGDSDLALPLKTPELDPHLREHP